MYLCTSVYLHTCTCIYIYMYIYTDVYCIHGYLYIYVYNTDRCVCMYMSTLEPAPASFAACSTLCRSEHVAVRGWESKAACLASALCGGPVQKAPSLGRYVTKHE